ncbi:hypothetical protein NC651_031407 [Populus alba x Populus x berolinensis]|nr:hypothetical protein NC651_031407 [Populus alba x Populus x berolinensis]
MITTSYIRILFYNSLVPQPPRASASVEEYMQQLPQFDSEMARERQEAEDVGDVLRYIGVVDAVSEEECVESCEDIKKDHSFAQLSGSVSNLKKKRERMLNSGGRCRTRHRGGPKNAQPTWAGLDPAIPAWSQAQASDPAGPNRTGGTRGVSPPVHALCEEKQRRDEGFRVVAFFLQFCSLQPLGGRNDSEDDDINVGFLGFLLVLISVFVVGTTVCLCFVVFFPPVLLGFFPLSSLSPPRSPSREVAFAQLL